MGDRKAFEIFMDLPFWLFLSLIVLLSTGLFALVLSLLAVFFI